MITENLPTLKIHQLTSEQYKREHDAGRIDNTALYLTPDETVLVVTVDLDTQTASHTSTEIYEHIQGGGIAVALTETIYVPMTISASGEAEFVSYRKDEDMFYGVKIFSDGACERVQVDMVTYDILTEKLARIISKLDPLIVTLDETTGKASHTPAEIYNHALSGGAVFLTRYGYTYPVSSITPTYTNIVHHDTKEYTVLNIDIWENGNFDVYGTDWAPTELLEDTIGDISAALDELHTYAQGLIDGGAAV